MERTRPAALDQDAHFKTIGDLPGSASLPELLVVVRSPGVVRAEVDALIRGLASPLAEGESPRTRADLLLSVIESSDVGDLPGSEGNTPRAAAVKALLQLGYPYALEIPPEALGLAPLATRREGEPEIPIAGLIATAVALIPQLIETLPAVAYLLAMEHASLVSGLLLLTVVLGPVCAMLIGAMQGVLWLQRTGVVTMALTGCLRLFFFSITLSNYAFPPRRSELLISLVSGISFLVAAFLTRRPGWLPQDTKPKEG
jgi:hypothetical protein